MLKQVTHTDGTWNASEYRYKDRKILIKSRPGSGMKAHAFFPNSDKVQFTLRFLFVDPHKLLQKVKNKIDRLDLENSSKISH